MQLHSPLVWGYFGVLSTLCESETLRFKCSISGHYKSTALWFTKQKGWFRQNISLPFHRFTEGMDSIHWKPILAKDRRKRIEKNSLWMLPPMRSSIHKYTCNPDTDIQNQISTVGLGAICVMVSDICWHLIQANVSSAGDQIWWKCQRL